jgi:RNA-binding motif protein, X-linked 2
MNTIREIQKINEQELELGLAGTPSSWHAKYSKSAWVYVGNLDHSLTEGDIICVLSQYGEIEDFHLVRDEETGKSKGFAFAKYEDSRSCILAVDNFCGIQVRELFARFCIRSHKYSHRAYYSNCFSLRLAVREVRACGSCRKLSTTSRFG